MRCPGSADYGFSSPESVYSREGTFAHAIAAKALERDCEAVDFVGETDGEFVFSEDFARAVQVYLDAVRSILLVEGGELRIEQKVVLIPGGVYGTADALIVVRGPHGTIVRLYVIDLKFGSGMLVEAQDNEQLLIYALAAMAGEGVHPQNVGEVVTMIVQPRAGDVPVRRATYTPAELANWQIRISSGYLEASQPGGRKVPGEHCHFCPGKSSCPALRDEAMAVAVDLFPNLDPTESVAVLPNVSAYTPAQLARALEGADIVEQWLKVVRAEALNRAKLGTKIPGMKLVQSIGNREWKNEAEAAKIITAYGVDPFERTLKSPAQVEKASKAIKQAIASLTERKVRGVVLAPESDRRPEVVDPSSMFELVDEQPQ
jgi:hypothetical protein